MQTLKNPLEEFMEGLRSDSTRRTYKYGIRWVTPDPNAFLVNAKRSKHEAEEHVISFIKRERERVAAATLRDPIAALKSFLDYYEVPLNWKRIKSVLPPARKTANDRAPSRDEIRKLLSACDLRMKGIVLILASSGMRVGGF
ncbi:MAG: hypothetical protein O7B32_00645, partial [Thaumarchaeota archaeon]|nr:hypothetical protein [Nitrososphaerota archaeon]